MPCDDLVEVKSIIRRVDGHLIEQRYIAGKLVSVAPAPFVLLDTGSWPWGGYGIGLSRATLFQQQYVNDIHASMAEIMTFPDRSRRQCAIIKEGQKEMVLWKPR